MFPAKVRRLITLVKNMDSMENECDSMLLLKVLIRVVVNAKVQIIVLIYSFNHGWRHCNIPIFILSLLILLLYEY